MYGFAVWFEDAYHHRNKKHAADSFGIFRRFNVQFGREPYIDARHPVPFQRQQVIADRMIFGFRSAKVHGIADGFPCDEFQSRSLHPFLKVGHIVVSDRPRQYLA
jgi:hypothetical protein